MSTTNTASPLPFLTVNSVAARSTDQLLFKELSFTIHEGESWAILGASASGKTSLLETLLGKHPIVEGSIHYHFYERLKKQQALPAHVHSFRDLVAFVAQQHHFKNLSNTTSFYYQQRFHMSDAEDAPTVESTLEKAFQVDSLSLQQQTAIVQVATLLNIQHLLKHSLLKLSNGQHKRLQIAMALLQQPRWLVLDNPFMGLDAEARRLLHHIINDIILQGTPVLLVTTPQEIPAAMTHVMIMEERQIRQVVDRKTFTPLHYQQALRHIHHRPLPADALLQWRNTAVIPDCQYVIQMHEVQIRYGDKTILEQVNWSVKQGEHWALLGENGAGKSTLLSLINGDNPQAYANEIYLFGQRKGSGESIWGIKRKIGFISPELHLYFSNHESCSAVIASGFFDTIGLAQACTPTQQQQVMQWMQLLNITSLADRNFRQVSASQQRLVLLARALIKHPPLLILDEPCQGLDEWQKENFRCLIDDICTHTRKTLIYVSHYREEIPSCVKQVLQLHEGKTIYQGLLSAL